MDLHLRTLSANPSLLQTSFQPLAPFHYQKIAVRVRRGGGRRFRGRSRLGDVFSCVCTNTPSEEHPKGHFLDVLDPVRVLVIPSDTQDLAVSVQCPTRMSKGLDDCFDRIQPSTD